MPSGDSNAPGQMYCRKCGYDLRAQTTPHRCPECGRAFDPADRKTFRTRPPRGPVWRWAKRVTLLLLALGLLLAMCWGWLYWGWKNEQVALLKMRVESIDVTPLGGNRLRGFLGSAGWVLDRATNVWCLQPTTDADLVHLKDFKRLRELYLHSTQVTDAGLAHLEELKGIQWLGLDGTQITDAGLVRLKKLAELQHLFLDGTKVTDAGLIHIKELKRLEALRLSGTKVTDVGLIHIKEIKGLRQLDLRDTHVTDAGLVHLRELKGLVWLDLRYTKVTAEGVGKLRASLPGAQIHGP